MIPPKKTRLSLFIGFLSLILLAILFYLFNTAAQGNVISRWVLFLVFGAVAVALASFGIGYVILLLMKTEEPKIAHRGSEVSYRRHMQHDQPGSWIDLAHLSQRPVAKEIERTPEQKNRLKSRKRSVLSSVKKKRR